jgi:hypothetical protein
MVCQNKSNNRKADAIAVLMENGEVDSYNNVLFYTANDEGDGSKNIECIVPFYQEDMI